MTWMPRGRHCGARSVRHCRWIFVVFLEYSLVVGADLLAEAGDLEDALGLLRRVLSSDTLTWDHRRDAERVVSRIRRSAGPQAVDHGLRPWDGEPWDVRVLARQLAERLSSWAGA